MAKRIWIDVEDLFTYGTFGLRPSGIQRLQFELCRALFTLPESKGRVFFVRHDKERRCLTAIPWEALEAVFSLIAGGHREQKATVPVAEGRPSVISVVWTNLKKAMKWAIHTLPPSFRTVVFLQIEVFIRLAQLVRAGAICIGGPRRQRCRRLEKSPITISRESTVHFATVAKPGDILAALGASWIEPDHGCYIERTKREKGLRYALLINDIIPLRRPEWFEMENANAFKTWFASALPLADVILTISAATARDVAEYAQRTGLALHAVPTPIPIGTGFKKSDAGHRNSASAVPLRLPPPHSYALMVSTIEARKNHVLLFRVWRQLLEDMPAASVPTLVFAGQVGWLVSDLMQQLHNSNFLNGKIVLIESPTDEELEALYDGCLFTLFPSFYEGWGLPVAESHAFGRPCIISKAGSLPEAGGSLARYIDPGNTNDAYTVIRETIQDRVGLREWGDRVRREFRPIAWSESARALLQALE